MSDQIVPMKSTQRGHSTAQWQHFKTSTHGWVHKSQHISLHSYIDAIKWPLLSRIFIVLKWPYVVLDWTSLYPQTDLLNVLIQLHTMCKGRFDKEQPDSTAMARSGLIEMQYPPASKCECSGWGGRREEGGGRSGDKASRKLTNTRGRWLKIRTEKRSPE